ncbi:hypothetical protein NU195Hw_Modified_197t1 [Hortaea werneckii]
MGPEGREGRFREELGNAPATPYVSGIFLTSVRFYAWTVGAPSAGLPHPPDRMFLGEKPTLIEEWSKSDMKCCRYLPSY